MPERSPQPQVPRLELVSPAIEHLPGYVAALERGWSPNTVRSEAAQEELAQIHSNAAGFLESITDPLVIAGPITLPDGSRVARLPGYRRWLWDGEFCGSIDFRWQSGTTALPPHCLGHIGYAVVPWKQGRGYATRALALLLPEARAQGLAFVELTTEPENRASQQVIVANGGVFVERFLKVAQHGGTAALRYRIVLN